MKYLKSILTLLIILSLSRCEYSRIKIDSPPVNHLTDSIFVEKQYKYKPKFSKFDKLGKQYYFIKIWGFLKYNSVVKEDTDWDRIFLKYYSKIENQNKQEFNKSILDLINNVEIPTEKNKKNNAENYALIDNTWFYDSLFIDNKIANKLEYIFSNYSDTLNKFIENNSIGNLEFHEKYYNDNYYPNKNVRMLGLARYWNIINYFYVYKNYTDNKWDDILIESIVEFKNSKNEIEYHKSVQKLSSYLNDCHSMVRSKILDEKIFGRFVPNFRVKMINDTFIITKFRVNEYSNYGLKIGDIILEIDSINIKNRYGSLNKLLKGANKLSEQRIINPYLFSFKKDKVKINI